MDSFIKCDWHDFYCELLEAIPPNAPEPQGQDVDIHVLVDSNHTGDKLTHHSQIGFIVYLNGAPIIWFSKKQVTIESSVFGTEFVALKQGMETL